MIGAKLKEIRESVGMNKKEFAEHIGLKYTTYNNYETEAREPASDFLILISEKFDVSIDYLLGLKDEKEILHSYQLHADEYEHIKKYRSLDSIGQETVSYILNRETARVTTLLEKDARITELLSRSNNIIEFGEREIEYHHSVSAGSGIFILGNEAVDTISIPNIPEYACVDYAIGVSGSSMEPDYYDGDIALVSQKSELNHGDVGIFIVNGNAYIKEYGRTELISRNPEVPNIAISDYDNIVCMGKVVGKL